MSPILSQGLLLAALAFVFSHAGEAVVTRQVEVESILVQKASLYMTPSPTPPLRAEIGEHQSKLQKTGAEVASESELVTAMGLTQYIAAATPDSRYGRISQDIQYSTLWEEILTLPMRRPRSFNAFVATVKTWLADLIVQAVEIRSGAKLAVDWKRSLAFAIFGFFYVGLVQWVLYVSLMAYLAPSAIVFSNEPMGVKLHDWAGQEDLIKQVMIDNFFLAAFIYFPVFYMLKEYVHTGFQRSSALKDGLRRYHGNFIDDNIMSILFWIPGDLIAFAAPMYMRLPLDHAVSFGWTMVLSYRRGGSTPPSKVFGAAAAAKKADGDLLKNGIA